GGGIVLGATGALGALKSLGERTAIALVLLSAARSWAWRTYRATIAIEGAPVRSLAVLDHYRPVFFLIGLALPVLLMAVGFVAPPTQPLLFALPCICGLATGTPLKLL